MSLFDQLVDEAVRSRGELAPLRPVVEKELLHHDILREMSEAGLLAGLTFIGGTCLRACYGSPRLSEDFIKEMQRFLPAATLRDTIGKEPYWIYLTGVVEELGRMALTRTR